MTSYPASNTVHRLVKEALDSGEASSLAEAEALFRGYCLRYSIDEADAQDPHHQAALLTGVALARRVFLGGVWVDGCLSAALKVPAVPGTTLREAVTRLGGRTADPPEGAPRVSVGGAPLPHSSGFHVRTAYAGWRGGIIPAHAAVQPVGAPVMPLAPMLSAALAVNEAFHFVRTGNAAVGRRPVGLSLWNPSSSADWLTCADEPALTYLPARLWLIGLGHLGQAYLWGLGLLPFPGPASLSLVLQDVDSITPSTISTSILSEETMIGQKKTRAMTAWAERRGFACSMVERLFADDFKRHASEPAVALCGLDNALGRRALDQVGFDFVVEAGLGHGYRDFRTIRLHTLPGPKLAMDIWNTSPDTEDITERPGYKDMFENGRLDRCGITILAGRAVGAPFVGAIAACLVLSEVLRPLNGGAVHALIELDLLGIDHRAVVSHKYDFSRMNPGYIACAA